MAYVRLVQEWALSRSGNRLSQQPLLELSLGNICNMVIEQVTMCTMPMATVV